jgi:hypothetical protein
MTRRRLSVRLRLLGRHAWQGLCQHYVTLVSVAVISFLFVLVMTSDSFASKETKTTAALPAATPEHPGSFSPSGPRGSVVYYFVQDRTQLEEITEALAADQGAMGTVLADQAVLLIAGTPEEETAAIARLNFDSLAAQSMKVDIRVLDLRSRSEP